MSCLRLRLPPARKAWKNFTSKLHSKLRKRKAINRHVNRVKPSTTISLRVVRPYKFRLQRKPIFSLRFHQNCRRLLRKGHAHVYVDKLFKEPAVAELVAESCQQQKTRVAKCVIKSIADRSVLGASEQSQSAASGNNESEGVTNYAGDDMWESLGIASPQMDGIDKRAEEFIARFRAEMKDQETLARRHL